MLPAFLAGDSHLERLNGSRLLELEQAAGCRVVNAAVGGANIHDLASQLAGLQPSGIVVVSVGTNDAAPWKRVPLPEFRAKIVEALGALRNCQIIYIAGLGVDEARLSAPNDRLDADMRRYADVAKEVVWALGGTVVDLADELSAIRAEAFAPDGVHLSTVAYDVVVPVLGEAIARFQRSAEHLDSLSAEHLDSLSEAKVEDGRHD